MSKTYLDPEDVTRLQKAAGNMRDVLLIRVLFHLGCRVTEALSLTVDDVDFDVGAVTIKHLKTHLKLSCPDCGAGLARKHTFCPQCGKKVSDTLAKEMEHRRQRVLPVDGDTLAMLKEYIKRGGPVIKGGKALIFGINRHRAWQVVKGCAGKAGLPKLVNSETGRFHNVSPHRLRDAFAVNAMKHNDSGDGMRFLQQHLGHTSFNTTARYRKVSSEESKDWYRKLWDGEVNDNSTTQT